jgi:formylmethanofuran dehydrogenase subunit C
MVRINGNAGKNTGALLNGGNVIINGDTDDFTAIDMIKGTIIVNGDAGKFLAANKKSGVVLARKGSPYHQLKRCFNLLIRTKNYY